jgi:hypothetical protein
VVGKANIRKLKRAQILLKLEPGWSTAQVAEAYGVCPNTVTNLHTRYRTGGLEAVLHDRKQLRLFCDCTQTLSPAGCSTYR